MKERISIYRIGLAVSIFTLALSTIYFRYFPESERVLAKRHLVQDWLRLNGKLIDVGGHRLQFDCIGDGEPTIILEAGLGMEAESWRDIPSRLAEITRVCSYSRAGLGYSDPANSNRTVADSVKDLQNLLRNGKIPDPYILVGHSFGAIIIRLYTAYHPDKVVGMVLIDPSHENQYTRFAALMRPRAAMLYLRHEGGANWEHLNLLASSRELETAPPLPRIPLIILSAEKHHWPPQMPFMRAEQMRLEMQRDLTYLQPNSKQIIARGCEHFIQWQNPELVIASIRKIVLETRSSYNKR